jgi:hypothetical protein
MPHTTDDVVPHTALTIGQQLISVGHGPGVLREIDALHNYLIVQHDGFRHPTTYSAVMAGGLQLPDGRWVNGPPNKRQARRRPIPTDTPTYTADAPLPATAMGAWPLLRLADAPAEQTLRQLVGAMTVAPLLLPQGPAPNCVHNPQWRWLRGDKFLLCEWLYESRLSVAVRTRQTTDAAGQSTMHFMSLQPYCKEGAQIVCEVRGITVAANGTEALAQLSWRGNAAFTAYLTCFYEHAPYLHVGAQYEFLLSGLVLNIKPSTQQSISVDKPDWLDVVNAKLPTPIALDAQGKWNLDVSELRYWMSLESKSPLMEFRAQVLWSKAFDFDPQVQAVYGARGYVMHAFVLNDSNSDEKMRIELKCPEKILPAGWVPQDGDWISGHLWLQAWLWRAAA